VEQAVEWCQQMLALPPQAMAATRRQARADLIGLFDDGIEREIEEAIASWWSDEAQRTLRRLAERLTKKKGD